MPELIGTPVRVEAAGEPPKLIDEFAGRASNGEERVVLGGTLHVETEEGGTLEVPAGQAVLVRGGEWVRYSTPEGAEYVAVCLPAFSPDTVHRDDD
jgi:hypothetical protein